jgi:colanic acid/amylovoran biosynthesis glycosyltransferase
VKIAYFVNQYPKVSHTFIRREILALERLGFSIQRIALRGWSEITPDVEDQKEQARTMYVLRRGAWGVVAPTLRLLLTSPLKMCQALRLAIHVSRRSDHGMLLHLIRLAEACCVLSWLRACGSRHLHAHFGTNSAEVAMYARCLGGPSYSCTIHGPEEFEAPMCIAEKVRRSAFVAAISSFGRSQLYMRCATADWPKIQLVRCGVEPAFYRQITPVAPQNHRLVCVGRLCEAKGQLLLVEAVGQLRSRGISMELVLAGDGPLRGEIEASIKRLGLGEQIRITGWISSEDVRREMLAARALVLPSFAEGLPVVIMEAMCLRRPVLSTFVAGIPELVRSGQNGWLFPAGSLQELADAMKDCLAKTDHEIQQMGDAAFERATTLHAVDVEAAKLAEHFRATATSGAS